jgi:hypothetical protein
VIKIAEATSVFAFRVFAGATRRRHFIRCLSEAYIGPWTIGRRTGAPC